MKKPKLYAIHKDGRKLHFPVWDADGEIVDTGLLTAAVTIDQNGETFPAGSVWIRQPRSLGLQEGWKFADTKPAEARAFGKRIRSKSKRTRRRCVMCTKPFLAKREDARLCSQSCRRRAARVGLTATDNAKDTVGSESHEGL